MMVATLKLYAHALLLAFWAALTWVLQLDPSTLLIVAMLATLAAASFMAERERAKRRRR